MGRQAGLIGHSSFPRSGSIGGRTPIDGFSRGKNGRFEKAAVENRDAFSRKGRGGGICGGITMGGSSGSATTGVMVELDLGL